MRFPVDPPVEKAIDPGPDFNLMRTLGLGDEFEDHRGIARVN